MLLTTDKVIDIILLFCCYLWRKHEVNAENFFRGVLPEKLGGGGGGGGVAS